MRCETCKGDKRVKSYRVVKADPPADRVVCHTLECGHRWHETGRVLRPADAPPGPARSAAAASVRSALRRVLATTRTGKGVRR